MVHDQCHLKKWLWEQGEKKIKDREWTITKEIENFKLMWEKKWLRKGGDKKKKILWKNVDPKSGLYEVDTISDVKYSFYGYQLFLKNICLQIL